jgi:lipid A ethanolaminephosphotransferase
MYVALVGLLPALIVARVRIEASSRARGAAFVLLSLVLGCGWLYANAQTWLWIDKNAKTFGGLVLPWSYVVNPVRYYSQNAGRKREPEPLPALTSTDPRRVVFILVIGESARAQNFSLYGYGRQTNPLLAQAGVIAFPRARSCSTYTTASVACMLSYRGAAAHGGDDEPLPSYLHRHGIEVIWRTNNFGEPPLKVDSFEHAEDIRRQCAGPCAHLDHDELLLHGLAARLRDAPDNTKTLVVLHQAGSHGPQYSRKYPADFEKFKPTCHTVELQKCSTDELVNAYDNTILYTDYLLNGVIELLRSLEGTASVMLYMSDHGESLGEHGLYLHGLPISIAPEVQTSVPLVVWMSDEFLRRRGATRPGLTPVADRTHDVVFHSVMGALGVTSKVYAPQRDLFRLLGPPAADRSSSTKPQTPTRRSG